jgi:hypothetical protein
MGGKSKRIGRKTLDLRDDGAFAFGVPFFEINGVGRWCPRVT